MCFSHFSFLFNRPLKHQPFSDQQQPQQQQQLHHHQHKQSICYTWPRALIFYRCEPIQRPQSPQPIPGTASPQAFHEPAENHGHRGGWHRGPNWNASSLQRRCFRCSSYLWLDPWAVGIPSTVRGVRSGPGTTARRCCQYPGRESLPFIIPLTV